MEEADRGATGRQSVGALVLAAGRSRRMGGIDKTFVKVLDRALILHTLSVFLDSKAVNRVALVLPESKVQRARGLVRELEGSDKVTVCAGGDRRQDSAAQGLEALGPCHWVVVHDGARPCLTLETLDFALCEARRWGNAVVARPVTDTVKRGDAEGFVTAAVTRDGLWAMQTPQIFPMDVLQRAYREVDRDVTDDASMVEALGMKVKLVPGPATNLKVTTPADLELAELILRHRESRIGAG